MKKEKIIVTEHDLHDHYNELYQFLGQFALDADFDKFDNLATVMEYNEPSEHDYQDYLKARSQTDELLEINPFPHNAIETATNLLISEATNETQKSEEVKKWLRDVVHLLELRVTGKL